jgi:hypothetical protein
MTACLWNLQFVISGNTDSMGGDAMDVLIALLAALVGYLLGSISFARIVMKSAAPGL